jgi:hypothetical protein
MGDTAKGLMGLFSREAAVGGEPLWCVLLQQRLVASIICAAATRDNRRLPSNRRFGRRFGVSPITAAPWPENLLCTFGRPPLYQESDARPFGCWPG